MIPIPVSVDRKQIVVSAHHLSRYISQLVHVIQSPLLGQRKRQSFQNCVDSEVRQGFRVAHQQIQQIELFHCRVVVVDGFVGMRDVRMPDPVDRGRELSQNSRVGRGIIALIATHVLLKMLRAEEVGQIVIHADLLDQPNHIITSGAVDLLVRHGLVGLYDHVAESVVLSQEEDLEGG